MPLTQQIIKTIVKDQNREELVPVTEKLSSLEKRFDGMENKIDKLTEIVVDLAGQFKSFGEEQIVMSGQISSNTARIEKLEIAEFGTVRVV